MSGAPLITIHHCLGLVGVVLVFDCRFAQQRRDMQFRIEENVKLLVKMLRRWQTFEASAEEPEEFASGIHARCLKGL